jgi:hypothetical protein
MVGAPAGTPQDSVDELGSSSAPGGMGELHRFIDGGALGYPAQVPDLVKTNPKREQERRIDTSYRTPSVSLYDEVQCRPPTEDAIDDLCDEVAVGRSQPTGGLAV